MTSSLLLVHGECVIFMCGVTMMNRRTDSCSSPVPALVFLAVESNIVDESCVTLRHHGSVWGYGRVSDCLLHLGRLLLLAAIFHNVDGAHGNEPSDTASSAFDGLGELNELVGCHMKGATKAHAAHSLKLLGVQLDASTDVAVIAPTSKRKTKLANFFSKHIDAGKLSPSNAGSFAGKAGFFNTTGLGHAGRAAMNPLCTTACIVASAVDPYASTCRVAPNITPLRAVCASTNSFFVHDSSSRPAG